MIVGKSKMPRALRDKSKLPRGIKYYNQSKAWVDSEMATKWFLDIFVPFKRTKLGDTEPAVLIWDNAPGHKLNVDLNRDPDIRVVLLPPNLAALHQPLDAGVIAALKCHYKTEMLTLLDQVVDHWAVRRAETQYNKSGLKGLNDGFSANLADAWRLVSQAWSAVSAETITNCFIKANCLPSTVQQKLLPLTEKGRQKLAVMHGAMDVDEDWSDWTVDGVWCGCLCLG